MEKTTKTNKQSDEIFDSDRWVKIESSHEVLDRPDKFAIYFEKVSKEQAKIKTVFKSELLELLQTNVEAQKEIKKLLKEVEQEDLMLKLKKFGVIISNVVSFLGGAIIIKIIDSFFKG